MRKYKMLILTFVWGKPNDMKPLLLEEVEAALFSINSWGIDVNFFQIFLPLTDLSLLANCWNPFLDQKYNRLTKLEKLCHSLGVLQSSS